MAMNRRIVELLIIMVLYMGVYVLLIGPTIGAVTGFDEPVTVVFNNEFARDLPLNMRGLVFFLSTAVVMTGYAHLKARMVGAEPSEYWGQ